MERNEKNRASDLTGIRQRLSPVGTRAEGLDVEGFPDSSIRWFWSAVGHKSRHSEWLMPGTALSIQRDYACVSDG